MDDLLLTIMICIIVILSIAAIGIISIASLLIIKYLFTVKDNDIIKQNYIDAVESIERQFDDKIDDYAKQIDDTEKKYKEYYEYAMNNFKTTYEEEIISSLRNQYYKSELEVEIKFIYDLVKILGYCSMDFLTRVPVKVRMGRQEIDGQADWVIYKRLDEEGKRAPFFVIEAKAPQVSIDDSVKEQARSYAFYLNVDYYLLTNGNDLKLYKVGIKRDRLLVNTNSNLIQVKIEKLKKYIGKQN